MTIFEACFIIATSHCNNTGVGRCRAEINGYYSCTRPKGHTGQHIATWNDGTGEWPVGYRRWEHGEVVPYEGWIAP